MHIEDLSVRRVFTDGRHNAFTDVVKWKGAYYIVFRNGAFHCSADGRIFVIRSEDLRSWEKVADLATEGLDTRDPRLLALDDRLLAMGYTSDKRYGQIFDHQQVRATTFDGRAWSGLEPFLDKHAHLWDVRRQGNYYYGGLFYNYSDPDKWTAGLARSANGLDWEPVSTICDKGSPDETGIEFLPDGTCMALVRRTRKSALLALAAPPYKEWRVRDTGVHFGGPTLRRIGDDVLLAARWCIDKNAALVGARPIVEENDSDQVSVTAMFWMTDRGPERPFILPSLKDTGYPGICHIGGNEWGLSYYSSHDQTMGSRSPCDIYLARFVVGGPDPAARGT